MIKSDVGCFTPRALNTSQDPNIENSLSRIQITLSGQPRMMMTIVYDKRMNDLRCCMSIFFPPGVPYTSDRLSKLETL